MLLLLDPIFLPRAVSTTVAVPRGSPCGSLALPDGEERDEHTTFRMHPCVSEGSPLRRRCAICIR